MTSAGAKRRSAAHIGHVDFGCRLGVDILHMRGCRVEPEANSGIGTIELSIVEPYRDELRKITGRGGSRDELSHQRPRDRRVAIRKMNDLGPAEIGEAGGGVSHARYRSRPQLEALKSRQADRPTIERRNCLDADAPQTVRPGLIERTDVRI